MKKIILISLITGMLLTGACVRVQPNTATLPPSPTPIEITAVQLYKEYTKDAAAADEKYLGRKLSVEGVAKEIGKESSGTPYLLLTATPDDTNGIYCTFPMDYGPILAKLETGQKVGITGIGAGFKDGNVLLDSTDEKKQMNNGLL